MCFVDKRNATEKQFIKSSQDYRAIVAYRSKQARCTVLIQLMNQHNANSLKREFLRYGPIKVAYQFKYAHSQQVFMFYLNINGSNLNHFQYQLSIRFLFAFIMVLDITYFIENILKFYS